MASDVTLELKRQTFHLFIGLFIAFAVYFLRPVYGGLILIPLIIAILTMTILPRVTSEVKIANHLLYHFEREKDRVNFPFRGAIWYSIGIMLPIAFLSMDIVCAIIAVLSSGDSMSTLIGKFAGKHKIGSKSVEGFLSFFLFGSVAAAIFVPFQTAVVFAFFGALIEFFAFMDDNFLVPVGLSALYIFYSIIAP